MNPSNQGQGFFGVKVSKRGVNVNQANANDLIYQSDYSSTIYYDNNNSRIVEGLLPDGNYGLWVSKPGSEANSPNAVTSNHLIFNSNQDIFKIVKKISMSTSVNLVNGNPTTWNAISSLPHGLTFTPAYYATVILDPTIASQGVGPQQSHNSPAMVYGSSGAVVALFCIAEVSVDAQNFYFAVQLGDNPTATYNFSATVYVLQETFS